MQCQPILNKFKHLGNTQYSNIHEQTISYEDIYGNLEIQVNIIKLFFQIEETRYHIKKKHLLPGGGNCQDPCTFGYISNGAADIISF